MMAVWGLGEKDVVVGIGNWVCHMKVVRAAKPTSVEAANFQVAKPGTDAMRGGSVGMAYTSSGMAADLRRNL